jgi:Cu/Ag efflux protein CusF
MHIKKYALLISLVCLVSFSVSCKRQTSSTTTPAPSPTPQNLKPIAVPPPPVIGKPYPGKGVVKLINRKEGWIEIDHEDIVDLMPAMEMEWSVEKISLLDNLKVGDKVNFTVVETGKGEFITAIKKIQE